MYNFDSDDVLLAISANIPVLRMSPGSQIKILMTPEELPSIDSPCNQHFDYSKSS